MTKYIIFLILIVCLGIVPAYAGSEDTRIDIYSIDFMVASYHVGRDPELYGDQDPNESNPGIGLTWKIGGNDNLWSAGIYKNTLAKQTVYVAAGIPLITDKAGHNIYLTVGGATGYSMPVIPIVYLADRIQVGDNFSVNLFATLSLGGPVFAAGGSYNVEENL